MVMSELLVSDILTSVPVAGIAMPISTTNGSTVQMISTSVDSWKVAGLGWRERRCANTE